MSELVLDPGRTYRVAFTRPVGLPGRVAREGVVVLALGAEIAPYREYVLSIVEVPDEPA